MLRLRLARRMARRAVSASLICRPRCTSSRRLSTAASILLSPVPASISSFLRTSAMPVTLLPGSSLICSGCSSQSHSFRSTRRITNGSTRCTRARPATSSFLARLSLHGINGLPRRSRTNTTSILSSTTTGGRPARMLLRYLSPPGDRPCGPCDGVSRRSPFGNVVAQLQPVFWPCGGPFRGSRTLSATAACRAAN